MNIVLFEETEIDKPLARSDPRADHVLRVLKRGIGDSFDAGIIDGPKGKARPLAIDERSLALEFEWGEPDSPLYPVDLIVGLSRPQTNRKILQEATALGARSLQFATTERGEPSYAQSRLWTSEEWRRHLIAGAAQAFSTRLPQVSWGMSLAQAMENSEGATLRIALDNYEATGRLKVGPPLKGSVALAVGSERGWTGAERELLRARGFPLVHLGRRVLRTETAVVAAVSQLVAAIDF